MAENGRKGPQRHPRRIENPGAKCPRHHNKDYRRLVETAWAAGWWCERRRKYIYCFPADARFRSVKVPMTPNQRTIENVRSNFRRAGLAV